MSGFWSKGLKWGSHLGSLLCRSQEIPRVVGVIALLNLRFLIDNLEICTIGNAFPFTTPL